MFGEGIVKSRLEGSELVELPEYVTEQAIMEAEQDELGHEDYVARLLRVVETTHTPANVALFGRWGSGKTGISNRLATEVENLPGFHFVYFDAFKHARLPLLRRFLLVIARKLGGKDLTNEYRRALYENTDRVRLSVPRERLEEVLWKWGMRVLCALLVVIYLFDFLAIFAFNQAEVEVIVDFTKTLLPVVITSSIVAVVVGLGAKYLSATSTTTTPDSEEQFEDLFQRLLEARNIGDAPEQDTLVVFIDELDRCSAAEVARTLESIKTFLDESGCIFIVAADRSVLEHALTEQIRQSTPPDLSNPYYSAGSAYLDKIFQHQINLPPLFPGRLTDFALRALGKVGGAWSKVDSREDVVSILLPVTVRSPRRVKVLLNAFAQSFALALARSKSSNLDKRVDQRAREVAKLVAIQVEFPLFAEDLQIHPDLPELVLFCADELAKGVDPADSRRLRGIPKPTVARAIGYAEGKLPTDLSLADSDSGIEKKMLKAQSSDLIDYLQQTRLVPGPKTDLVHLEGLGHTTGLDEALAIELNDLALKNRPELLVEALERINDPAERQRAILRLRDLARESKGNDADNAIRALLRAFPTAERAMPSVAEDILGAVLRYDRQRDLDETELPSALDLAILGRSNVLTRAVLGRREASDLPLRAEILDRTPALLDEHLPRLGELVVRDLVDDAEAGTKRLLGMGDTFRQLLVSAAADALGVELDEISSELTEDIDDEAAGRLNGYLDELFTAVGSAAAGLYKAENPRSAEVLYSPVLQAKVGGRQSERIDASLRQLGPALTDGFNTALGKWLASQPSESFVRFADSISGRLLAENAVTELGQLAAQLWREGAEEDSSEASDGLAKLSALQEEGASIGLDRLTTEVERSFEETLADASQVERQETRLNLLDELLGRELIGADRAGEIVLAAAKRSLEAQPVEGDAPEIARLLQRMCLFGADKTSIEAAESILEALASSSWIETQRVVQATIRLALGATAEEDKPSPPFSPSEIADLARANPRGFIEGITIWLERFHPSPAAAARGLRPVLGILMPKELVAPLAAYSEPLDPDERYLLIKDLIEPPSSARFMSSSLQALGISGADPERVTKAIVKRYEEAPNNGKREGALEIWEAFEPRIDRDRRALITKVFIPLAGHGIGGFKLARKYLHLCKDPPRGTKGNLLKAIEEAPRRSLRRSMEKRVVEVGLSKPKK